MRATRTAHLNILLLVTDQERSWADLPAGLSLPRRRDFAAAATSFQNHHVNAIACSPSRAILYTGQHMQKTGVFDNNRAALDAARTPTLGNLLKRRGYHTTYIGKWHLGTIKADGDGSFIRQLDPFGFDEFHPNTPRGDSFGKAQEGASYDRPVAETAARWLRNPPSEPWLAAVNFINPHDIMFFDATGEQGRTRLHADFVSRMAGAPDRTPYSRDLGFDLPSTFRERAGHRLSAHVAMMEDCNLVFGLLPQENEVAWRRYQNYYFNCLRDVDAQIGVVLDALAASGQADRTVVALTSDHGEMAGAHGLRAKGPLIYKENFRVPLVIRHPDGTTGASTLALSSGVDLVPTLLSLSRADGDDRAGQDTDLPGYDLSTVVAAPRTSQPRNERAGGVLTCCSAYHASNPQKKHVIVSKLFPASGPPQTLVFPDDYIQFELRTFLRGVYDGRYRFGRYFRPGEHHVPKDWDALWRRNDLELYDTAKDPDETDNLARQPQGNRALILQLNDALNRLTAAEIGVDDGSYLPGDSARWTSP